jgi:hypothetical protein
MLLLTLLMAALLSSALSSADDTGGRPMRDTQSDTWVATDALGRTLPGHEECGPPREGKFVGIFYFQWMNPGQPAVYDISKLLAANPDDPQYGPRNAFHWWGEPHVGYYTSTDEFVFRLHAQMLVDAGVDAVFLDVTNALTYDEHYMTMCRVWDQMRQQGQPTPQMAFLANSRSEVVVQHLYDVFYSQGLYPDLWFRWQGKPLMLAPTEGLSETLRAFFTLRQSWAWTNPNGWFGDGRDKWPWLDNHPQQPGWHTSPDEPEQMAVCVAQHPTSNIGRSFHDGKEPPPDQARPAEGLCFAEQWRRALEVDPEFVFITGWNEWIAQRFVRDEGGGPGHFLGQPLPVGGTFFVDQYNQEYSRDIEPMRGGHGDSYYYQMIANIRRFKGVRPRPHASAPKRIDLEGDFAQWADVTPEYLDDLGDTAFREHPGYGDAGQYVNKSGRNDIELSKVARDEENLYFYARTREPLTSPRDHNWMLLLLDTDGDPTNGWAGFDFVVNRVVRDAGTTVVERHAGGWSWEPVGEARLRAEGRELHLAMPRALLGLGPEKGQLRFDLKWADNLPDHGDPLDFIDQGDTAPNGRFRYRYEE